MTKTFSCQKLRFMLNIWSGLVLVARLCGRMPTAQAQNRRVIAGINVPIPHSVSSTHNRKTAIGGQSQSISLGFTWNLEWSGVLISLLRSSMFALVFGLCNKILLVADVVLARRSPSHVKTRTVKANPIALGYFRTCLGLLVQYCWLWTLHDS